jgi:diguanylate cyclase (GGDEF)-like protein/PAS domain S-box-containing protein
MVKYLLTLMADLFERAGDAFPRAPTDAGFYHELLDQMSDGVFFVDRERRIQYWNKAAQQLTSYAPAEVVGRFCHQVRPCHTRTDSGCICHEECPLKACMTDGQSREINLYLRSKSGRKVPAAVRVRPMKGADGAIVGAIEIFSDDAMRSETRRKMESMQRLAYLDHLTQMPNRRFLETTLASAVAKFRVNQDPFGVIVIDLDEFKSINDCFGHIFGDRALRVVGEMLSHSLRPSDTVGRWGGDEFVAIVLGVDAGILKRLADRCVRLVKQVALLCDGGQELALSVSIGAVLSRPGEDAEEILRRADELMYQSKSAGRGCAHTG